MEPTNKLVLTSLEASKQLGSETDILKLARVTGMLWSRPAPPFIKSGEKKVLYKLADITDFINAIPSYNNNAEVPKKNKVAGNQS